MALPEANPTFRAHFTDPVYDAEGADLGPFGNDEGWDLLMDWGKRRDELGPESNLETVLGTADVRSVAGPMEGVNGIETAQWITGAAFTLLRLTGRLPEDDRALALEALEFRIATSGPEQELVVQRDDLVAWRNPG
ncbi:MAG: hypothetical protein WKF50_01950 [Nocardioides sp.]